MQPENRPERRTPEHRRLVTTDVPGVYKRGSRYVAITRHKGKRYKTYHRTKSEAKAAKGARDAGARPSSREPFDKYVERWLREYSGRTSKGLAATTRADYAYLLHEYAVPFFKTRKIGDIGPLDVKLFIDHLAKLPPKKSQNGSKRLSPATIRRILCPLKAMLAEAYELELIKTNPANVRVVVPGERSIKKPKTMTTEQIATVLPNLPERDRVLFGFLSRTGVRIAEALGAKWADIEQTDDGPVFTIRRQFYRGEL